MTIESKQIELGENPCEQLQTPRLTSRMQTFTIEHIDPRYNKPGPECFFFTTPRGRIHLTAKLTATATDVSEKLRTRANRVRLVETAEGPGKRQRTSKYELSVRP